MEPIILALIYPFGMYLMYSYIVNCLPAIQSNLYSYPYIVTLYDIPPVIPIAIVLVIMAIPTIICSHAHTVSHTVSPAS